MKVCSDIKRRIDEADQSDQLSHEITQHTALCASCRNFAAQRTLLRSLITAGGRVNAPLNFDAMLNARLAEIKTRKSFAWFSPTIYLRFGAATAAIVVAVCAAQYSNLFATDQALIATIPQAMRQTMPSYTPLAATLPSSIVTTAQPDRLETMRASVPSPVAYNAAHNSRRTATSNATLVADNSNLLTPSSLLMRGPNGDHEVLMPGYTVGQQQQVLYGNASRMPPPARPVDSF